MAASLAREAALVYQQIDSGAWAPGQYLQAVFEALPAWVGELLRSLGVGSFDSLQERLAAAAAEGSKLIATRALGVGLHTFDFLSSLFIMLYLAFFLLRDGDQLLHAASSGVPLEPMHRRALGSKFSTVVRATVKGSLVVAVVQGTLGGLAFWVLGVQGALLWAVLMAFLSLVPAVGAALVWAPVALWLALQGEWPVGHRPGRLGCAGDRPGRQPVAPHPGGQGHPAARLCGDDLHPGRHVGVRPERLCHRPGDRRDVHRRLADLGAWLGARAIACPPPTSPGSASRPSAATPAAAPWA